MLTGLTALLLSAISDRARAHEPVSAFIDAACQRGYYDSALTYLDVLKSASYINDDVKKTLLFQQGAVIMRQAGATSDAAVKARLYDEAADKLKKFLAESPDSDLVASASGRLATMEVEKARNLAGLALNAPKDERETKLADARRVFEEARQQLMQAEKDFSAALATMPKLFAPGEEEKKLRRNELAADLAEAQLTAATIDYDLAKTYEPNSEDAKRYLDFAAQKFGKVFEDYRTRGAGLFARFWEGKCYQERGDRKKALSAYQDLLDMQGRSEPVRVVRAKALRQAIECWSLPEEKKFEEAITRGEEWLTAADRMPPNDPDALGIRYLTAVAHQKQMATLAPKDPERKQHQQSALKLARHVAKYPGEFKNQAAKLVVALGGNKEKDPDAEPTTFAAARDKGKEALEKMAGAKMSREVAIQTDDKEELAAAEKLEKEGKADAARYFRMALSLDPGKAKIEEINPVRYYVCYFEYDAGNFPEAAVLGDYLAFNFPQTAEARQAARIALASWVKVYSTSRSEDKSFETGKVNRIAEYIVKTWPDQDEAAEASATLLNFAIQRRDTEKVLAYLERIPAESPKRAESELKAGQALWSNYLVSARLPEDERPPQDQLNNIKAKAAEILEKGVERMREKEEITPTLVAAVLSLAQILADTGQPDKAIEWLEHDTVGPLKLLNEGSDVVFASERMPIEIYKLALRSYVAVEPQRLEDAERVMNALEKAVNESGDAKASETLTLIYISLGRELQQQLEELRNSKKQKELKAVSDGFETFLSRIVGRQKGNTWSSLNWVAETFYSLGTGFDDGKSATLSADARRYYEQAVKAYQEILARSASDPKFAPNPDALIGVRLRMAVCMRKTGRYDDAIKSITSVLADRPMMLPAQMLGAETYQAKGVVDKDAYAHAILGGTEKDAKNQPIVWGWAKLSKLTMNNEKFADTFHQSRIRLAECRYQYGMLNKDKNKRRKTIDAAKQDLWLTYKLYPNLGGPQRAEEYNCMLKQIQRALGDKTSGLEEFRKRAAEADRAAAAGKQST